MGTRQLRSLCHKCSRLTGKLFLFPVPLGISSGFSAATMPQALISNTAQDFSLRTALSTRIKLRLVKHLPRS